MISCILIKKEDSRK